MSNQNDWSAAPDHIADTRKIVAADVQGEPVATIHVDGSFVHVAWRIPAPSRCAMDVYTAPQPTEQPECGCCGQTVQCDDDCDAVIFRKAGQQPQQDVSELVKAAQKFDRDYARRKLELVLRDLRDYTADEFWRDISRIASGATGLPSAEHLKSRVNELEAELATARAGWQETIAKMASRERPAYEEQQQRIAKLEAINLGLTKTLVELHAEKAKLVEALRSILGWRELRSGNDFPVERIEEIARDALAAHRVKENGNV